MIATRIAERFEREHAAPGFALPLLWLAFVVYGSLVPLEFRALPLDEAWARFQRTPFLDLGVESRADWVANGVLYLPLGLLWARALQPRLGGMGSLLAVALGWTTALAVEFAQLYFPPRTVSLNDLMAEGLGTLIGVALAPLMQPWASRLHAAWQRRTPRARPLLNRALEAYAVLYVALCFFPYDFLLSRAELSEKLAGGLVTPTLLVERGWALALLLLAVEVALLVPIGVALARWRRLVGQAAWVQGAAAGAVLGVVIEGGQILLASGVSQGASVLTRALGVALGAGLAAPLAAAGWAGVRGGIARWGPLALLPYAGLLLFASGWGRGGWHGLTGAAATWAELRWLPFFYHYYTTEVLALLSLLSVSLMYLPLAVLGWARRWPALPTLGLIALVVTVVEAGKLFFAGLRPDPTNVLVALAATGLLGRALRALDVLDRPAGVPEAAAAVARTPGPAALPGATLPPISRPWALAVAVGVALLMLASVARFPAFALPLWVLLAAAAVAVLWRPVGALALIPAALPVLDLAPWTGRVFWTEFDALLGLLLVLAWARSAGRPARLPLLHSPLAPALALLGLSLAIATLRALWPWPGLDDNSWQHPFSALNALRIVKGALWAWAFVAVWQRLAVQGEPCARAFGVGMNLGLAGTVLWVLWERATFPGLLDFEAVYRVTGPFSAMHRGGGFIECYLAAGSAFALAWAVQARGWVGRGAALLLLAGAAYAVMVTFSRNGYVAFALVLVLGLVLGLAGAWRSAGAPHRPAAGQAGPAPGADAAVVGAGTGAAPQGGWPRGAVARAGMLALALGVVAAVTLPVLGGSFARERLAQVVPDFALRQAQWAEALQVRSPGWGTALMGEGLGRYPELRFWRSHAPTRTATYRLEREAADGAGAADSGGTRHFLRLGPGAALYIEQIVPAARGERLTLALDLRAPVAGADFYAALCAKSLLTSSDCEQAFFATGDTPGQWTRVEAELDAQTLGEGRWPLRPLMKLALVTPGSAPPLDVARVALRDAQGRDLLVNGDFGRGMDRWFWSTDAHALWHVDNLPLAVAFDQGALGLLAWGLVVLLAAGHALRLGRSGRAELGAAAVAAAAFGAAGLLNTLIDEPRFLMLLLLWLWLAAREQPVAPPPQRPVTGAF